MATITTLRPSAVSSGVGWSAVPSGDLAGVTSDDNDATYALWSGSGSAMILATPADAPPAGERRHLVRLQARGEDGDAWWAVRTNLGSLVAGAAGSFGASPETISGSWQAGVPLDGSIVLSCYVTGQSTGVKINELYLDVDTRLAPSFTPQILDGTGTSTTTISDTVTPTVRVSALDLDGLTARQYRFWVTLNGATVWDTGVVSGAPVNRLTAPLDNGSYVANLQVWSTLGTNTAYASDIETLAFTVSVGEVPAPDAPVVTDIEDSPFFAIEVCAPNMASFDDYVGYIEVQRVDCPLGGYLALTGTAGSYASAPDLVDTVRYSFDSTASPWVGEGTATVARVTTPVHDGAGALRATDAFSTTGFDEVRFNDNQGLRDLSAAGPTLGGWVYVPTANGGLGWQARMELQDPSFTWVPGPNVEIPFDTWTWVEYTPDPALLADCRSMGWAIGANDVGGNPNVYVDTVTQGTPPFLPPPTDLQVTVTAGRDDGWRPANTSTDQALVAKYDSGLSQRSWALVLDADGDGDPALAGRPALLWTTDGVTIVTASATERAPIDPFGNITMRATLDVDNGAGGWTVEFETLDEDGAWVRLGDLVTGTGTTSIFAGNVPLTVGSTLSSGAPNRLFEGRVYSVQVTDPTSGNLYAAPDFTGRAPGTDTITDTAGNTWTINAPAALTSTMAATSLAILGPLGTDECADWTDYSLPRSAVARACDHAPEPCCSYYRARTVGRVDGALLVSEWSDAWNPGIPPGLIFAWPDTQASIPAGWRRATELDGRYPKGVANVVTQPGGTGGAATHTHTTSNHRHELDHSHAMGGSTAAATGTFSSTPGTAGSSGFLNTHTHTRPANTNTVDMLSPAATPDAAAHANDPARLDVVWIESNGQPLGVPAGGLALMGDISPAGWTTYADASGRFLKGASAGQDGGATYASEAASHTHEIAAHTHDGLAHLHTSDPTGMTSGNRTFSAGPQSGTWAASHQHPITVNSSSTAPLQSASGGTSGAASASPEPPYRNLRVRENTSGVPDLPVGLIGLWTGSLATIPESWQLCDGSNGTPDMLGRHVKAATSSIGGTGGSLADHDHSTPNHTHETTGHSHTTLTGEVGGGVANLANSGATTTTRGDHVHVSNDTNSATPTVGNATSGTTSSTTTEPPYTEVAFVQLMEEPTPPPTPPTFCLDWDPEEALIRTTSADGPLWAPVWGKFEWARVRPFTAEVGVRGTRFVTTAPPGGRDLVMTAAVESEEELARLQAVLNRPLVLISPIDMYEVWAAPVASSVKVVKIGRIRQVTASFIATGPEPPPQLADVA